MCLYAYVVVLERIKVEAKQATSKTRTDHWFACGTNHLLQRIISLSLLRLFGQPFPYRKMRLRKTNTG